MSYCIMRLSKIKSFDGQGGMVDRYKHNMRFYDVINADHAMQDMNRELIELNAKDYKEAFYENIKDYEKSGVETKVRKNAILAFEVMLTYSKDAENIDIEEWCKSNIKWLNDTFNKKTEYAGEIVQHQNVVSAVLHMDETTPHIHAIVIPRDDKGNLNGTSYVENAVKMRKLQTDYASYMKKFSLQRGLEHSVSRHTNIKQFYDSLNQIYEKELPLPYENESINQYYTRANKEYVSCRLKSYGQELELKRLLDEERTKNVQAKQEVSILGKYKKLEKMLSDEVRDEAYDIIFSDVRDAELLKKAIKENPEDIRLKAAIDICKDIIEKQRQLELLRDVILYEKEHREYEPYGV